MVKEKNRKLLEDAIVQLDFKVNELARGLKTSKSMTIGVLIPEINNIFSMNIISNIENILLQNGYSTIICDCRNNAQLENEKLNFLINKMVDGIIIMPLHIKVDDLSNIKIPVVLIDRAINNVNCDTVLVDNLGASYNAVQHLIKSGHKRIGIICGNKEIYTANERLKGYIKAYKQYSLSVDKKLIKYGSYDFQSGYDLLIELMNIENPPTSVFVTNYEMTLGSIIAINEKGIKIPDELSIIGFDNLEMARIVNPPLSIVAQPTEEIGKTAAEIMLKRLKGDIEHFPEIISLKTNLMVKKSVKKLM